MKTIYKEPPSQKKRNIGNRLLGSEYICKIGLIIKVINIYIIRYRPILHILLNAKKVPVYKYMYKTFDLVDILVILSN